MSLHFQASALVYSPSYPNAVTWSEENFVAVASGSIVTILNPAMPSGPRGLINIPASKAFPIGVIEREDLTSSCMLPTALSRNDNPCVRSISWSPIGLAPNSGCLLAVCTTDGHVKLYRMPFCEFSAEWIEVLDVSDLLHNYFNKICFEESAIAKCNILPNSKRKRNDRVSIIETETQSDDDLEEEDFSPQITPPPSKSKSKAQKKPCDTNFSLITAQQYSSRNAMLSSLVVAWSPILHDNNNCSILAIGSKSGKVSLWRIHTPKSYSIINITDSINASLSGLIEAHSSWVTSITWASYISDTLKPHLLFATGSSDGSVKIWQVSTKELLKSSELSLASVSLVKEITCENCVPVSTLALIVPVKAPHTLLLAIGKGSGTIEVWFSNIPTGVYRKAGTFDAHDHIVTGLAWAFDGACLYSCSHDNSLKSWSLHGNLLCEASIPSNTPGVKNPIDVPHVYNSCYGVAFSPGNLVVAVVRSFDINLLNPMYEKRALKAAVEFLWIGGQEIENSCDAGPDFDTKSFPGFPEKELISWESNILWSLNQHEHLDKTLVTWDVIAALLAFKQTIPKYTEYILSKWLKSFLGEESIYSSKVSESLSKLTSRQLNLINIITRHVILKELKAEKINSKQFDNEEDDNEEEEEEISLWMKLIMNSEMELRFRLVRFSFSVISNLMSESSTNITDYWSPTGLAQMEQWVTLNKNNIKDLPDIKKIEKRQLVSKCKYVAKEQCSFCSAIVPFESAEVAFCKGVGRGKESGPKHKLARCAVSMQICPVTPTWYCMSCQRRASELVPETFFFKESESCLVLKECVKPFCVFCGLLLQRSLPDFFLSASPT